MFRDKIVLTAGLFWLLLHECKFAKKSALINYFYKGGLLIMNLRRLRKKIAMTLAAGCVAGSLFAPVWMPRAEAFGWVDAVNIIVGGAQVYGMYFNYFMEKSSYISDQNAVLGEVTQSYGAPSSNSRDIAFVDGVMEQLLDRGKYSVDARSLPYKWWVLENNNVNAFCAYNNLVCVFSGLLIESHYDRDMVAGVLAHEITHGMNHHTMKANAKKMAEVYGVDYLHRIFGNENTADITKILLNYDLKKNTDLPLEYEADEEGFYIAASAGFNPGGVPAMMAALWRTDGYRTYADFSDVLTPNNHPDSDKRLDKACKLLTEYSYNHVKIIDRTKVYVDDTLICDVQPEGEYPAMEKACLVAGGLAKEFHDKRLGSMWPFEHKADGSVVYDSIGDAKKWAKDAIREAGNAALLEDLVTKAYSADSKSGIRDELYGKELERLQEYADRTERLSKLDKDYAARKIENGAAYMAMGSPRQAEFEVNLAIANGDKLKKPALSQAHAVKGYVKALQNLVPEAEKEMDAALALDPMNVTALTGRAAIYCDKGETEKALAACQQALRVRANNPTAYDIQGRVYDKMGDVNKALASFQRAHELDGNIRIPNKYAAMIAGEPLTEEPATEEE